MIPADDNLIAQFWSKYTAPPEGETLTNDVSLASEYKVLDFAIKMEHEAPGLAAMTAALNEAAGENWVPLNQGQVISVPDGMRYITVILTRQVYKEHGT